MSFRRGEGRVREMCDSQKSCSSTAREHLERPPGFSLEPLEVEEILIAKRRCNFSRKRSFTTASIRTTGSHSKPNRNPESRPVVRHPANNASAISQENGSAETLLNLRNTLKSRILSAIDLSIISESKNQSKLETPQSKVAVRYEKQTQPSNRTTTFVKWSQSRKPSTKKEPSFNSIIEFSDHSICDLSINPCLTSFHQDMTLNGSAVASRMGFKEFLSKSCKLLPSIQIAEGKSPLERNFSKERKNIVAKKIINMEKLFAEKGIPLAGKPIDMPSLFNKKDILAKLFEKPQKSMIRFQATLESVVHFETSIDED